MTVNIAEMNDGIDDSFAITITGQNTTEMFLHSLSKKKIL